MSWVTDPQRPDLGGNIRGGDANSWTPALWRYLLYQFQPKSVLDVGCGEGHAVQWFRDAGTPALGIDGLYANVRNAVLPMSVVHCDLTERSYPFPTDLVICIEVVEHIQEQHIENLLTTLCNGAVIAMTHATPGQGGWNHCNEQHDDYWIDHICARGYDAVDVGAFRDVARLERPSSYFAKSGLVFRRCPAL